MLERFVATASRLCSGDEQPAVKPSSDKVHDHEVLFVKSVCLLQHVVPSYHGVTLTLAMLQPPVLFS